MIKRWAIAPRLGAGRSPLGIHGLARGWAIRGLLPDGRLLVEAEFESMKDVDAAKLVPGVVFWLSLTAPASSLDAEIRALVDGEAAKAGRAALAAGDDGQQSLRKLRDALGLDFTVDKPF